jgi:ribonuclease BN (tRNA processing enzyme)
VGLSLTVLGCSGSYPGKGEACSSYLVRSGSTTVWLDAGSGSMANLQQHVGLDAVDAVVLTHEHPDHWTTGRTSRVTGWRAHTATRRARVCPCTPRRA